MHQTQLSNSIIWFT